jgi:ubiquinone/menaquinone biosynthesis C-methylase UbiE
MGLYSKFILPRIVHLTCSLKPNMRQREKIVPLARGQVLEIGIGSGLNLPYYDAGRVTKVWGLEPSPEMIQLAQEAVESVSLEVEFIDAAGDEIPLETDSVDTVLITYTLCTIPEPQAALQQMKRVLRPEGELLFCEHGAAPDEAVRRWQDRINPLWKRLSGGCNLNRAIPEVIEQGGFSIKGMETMYIPGWRPASFNYWGTAVQV